MALRKLGLPPALVRERLAFYAGFDLVPTTSALLAGALDLYVLHRLPYYGNPPTFDGFQRQTLTCSTT